MIPPIPTASEFYKNVTRNCKEQGKDWIDSLPTLVEEIAQKWQLSNIKVFEGLYYNYVAEAFSAIYNRQVILKLRWSDVDTQREVYALDFYEGHGCARILEKDFEKRALLLEKIIPGVTLKKSFSLEDDEAVIQTAKIMKQLHSKPWNPSNTYNFPKISDWFSVFHKKENDILPQKHLQKAKELASVLLETQAAPVLLHADLHHENILSSHDGWLAIDPHGAIGEPAYEVGAFIRNPHSLTELLSHSNVIKITHRRFDLFSDLLGFDKKRLMDWSYVQLILSACWEIEVDSPFDHWVALADVIDSLNV